jgi:aspartyl-tRNA(Asn)/glutamyl-tRNA(Gln) amidotransferase subunit A
VIHAKGALISGADYVQAQRVRRVAQRALRALFDTVDVVLGPTTATGAIALDDDGSVIGGFDVMMTTLFTAYWNAVGNPALAVPMGFTAAGLPLSLQIAGRPFEEGILLRAGDAYQRVTGWHRRVPPLVEEAAASA